MAHKENQIFVTAAQLAAIVQPVTRSQMITIIYEGAHRFSREVKKVKPLTAVTKVVNAYLNHDYGNKVRNLTGSTEFQSYEMKGKSRLSSTVVQSDKTGELLLDYKGLLINDPTKGTRFETLSLKYNGVEISYGDAVKNGYFQPAMFKENETQTSGRGLVEKDQDFRMFTLGFDKIQRLIMDGVEYIVVPEAATEQ